jgi:DNA-binding NtrC family response regulator
VKGAFTGAVGSSEGLFAAASSGPRGAAEGHQWPGNIRQLENVVERAMVLGSGPVIDVDALPPDVRQPGSGTTIVWTSAPTGSTSRPPSARIEQRYIEMALERTSGVQTRAAEFLKVSFRQFRYKLRKHSLRALSFFARSK